MKRICAWTLLLLVFAAPAALAGEWTGNANLLLGAKAMEEDDWEPLEEQAEVAIRLDFREKAWPVNLSLDLVGTRAEEDAFYAIPGFGTAWADIEATTSEWNLGVRKIWEGFHLVRPYVNGGLAIIHAEVEVSTLGVSVDRDDTGVGYFLGGGVYWTLAEHFNLGLDLRYSWAEVGWDGFEGNGGGSHAGLLVGYHW